MEAKKQPTIKRKNTKKNLMIMRRRSLEDMDGNDIRQKDPKAMNDDEKLLWKIAIQADYENVDDLLNAQSQHLKEV